MSLFIHLFGGVGEKRKRLLLFVSILGCQHRINELIKGRLISETVLHNKLNTRCWGLGESCTSLIPILLFAFEDIIEASCCCDCTERDPPAGCGGEPEQPLPAAGDLRRSPLVTAVAHLLSSCHDWMPREIKCDRRNTSPLSTPLIWMRAAAGLTVGLCLLKAMQGDVMDGPLRFRPPPAMCVGYTHSPVVIHWSAAC